MKTYVLTLAAALLAPATYAQGIAAAKVPAAAAAAFKQHFPAAKAVTWEKEGADYEAGFAQGKAKMSAVITAAGVLKEIETAMAVAQLPAPVQKALASQYKTAKIMEAAKIVTAATGATSYEAEIDQNGRQCDVLFRSDGTIVRK